MDYDSTSPHVPRGSDLVGFVESTIQFGRYDA